MSGGTFAVDLHEVWFPYPKYDLQKRNWFLNIIDLVKTDGWVKTMSLISMIINGTSIYIFWRQFKNDILNMLYDWKSKLRNEFKVISLMDWDTISRAKIIFRLTKYFFRKLNVVLSIWKQIKNILVLLKKTGKLCEYTALPKITKIG